MSVPQLCDHCKMDIEIANPSGYCNHVYYPDNNCDECKRMRGAKEVSEVARLRVQNEDLSERLTVAEKEIGRLEDEVTSLEADVRQKDEQLRSFSSSRFD